MILRPETPAEYLQAEEVHRLAFAGPKEAQVVAAVRNSPHYRPDWSLVAQLDGQVAGHILFSYVGLQDPSGTMRPVVVLAPLAIHPQFQNRGLGKALVQEGLKRIEAAGEGLVLVRGHAHYYPQFGFRPSHELAIWPPFAIEPSEYMAKPLAAYHPSLRGTVRYPAAFAAVGYAVEY